MYDINYFMPGQLWHYDHRDRDHNSLLTVLAVDEEEEDTIIHVRLDHINFDNDGFIEHIPFSADALMHSVTGFIKHLDEIPAYKAGYDHWQQAYRSGKAGYWKVPVKEAVEMIAGLMVKKDQA